MKLLVDVHAPGTKSFKPIKVGIEPFPRCKEESPPCSHLASGNFEFGRPVILVKPYTTLLTGRREIPPPGRQFPMQFSFEVSTSPGGIQYDKQLASVHVNVGVNAHYDVALFADYVRAEADRKKHDGAAMGGFQGKLLGPSSPHHTKT